MTIVRFGMAISILCIIMNVLLYVSLLAGKENSYNIRMCLKGLFWKNNYDMILITQRFLTLYMVWYGLHLVLGGYGYLYGAILSGSI